MYTRCLHGGYKASLRLRGGRGILRDGFVVRGAGSVRVDATVLYPLLLLTAFLPSWRFVGFDVYFCISRCCEGSGPHALPPAFLLRTVSSRAGCAALDETKRKEIKAKQISPVHHIIHQAFFSSLISLSRIRLTSYAVRETPVSCRA